MAAIHQIQSSPPAVSASGLWRLPQVLEFVQLGRTQWLIGVQRGVYPQPVRLSARRIAWRVSDIQEFVNRL